MTDPDPVPARATALLMLTDHHRQRGTEDPFGNPILSVALAISRQIDSGELSSGDVAALVVHLRDAAFARRAARIAAYVGGTDPAANDAALGLVAQQILRPDPEDSIHPVKTAVT
jgi:phosphoenolpyruvate carboxylase